MLRSTLIGMKIEEEKLQRAQNSAEKEETKKKSERVYSDDDDGWMGGSLFVSYTHTHTLFKKII